MPLSSSWDPSSPPKVAQRCQRIGHMEKRPEKDLRSLACIKADEKKLDDIRVVRDFPEVLPDDLLGLPLVREIEFRIDLIPGASPVVRSPYRYSLSEMFRIGTKQVDYKERYPLPELDDLFDQFKWRDVSRRICGQRDGYSKSDHSKDESGQELEDPESSNWKLWQYALSRKRKKELKGRKGEKIRLSSPPVRRGLEDTSLSNEDDGDVNVMTIQYSGCVDIKMYFDLSDLSWLGSGMKRDIAAVPAIAVKQDVSLRV
ncbi:hypothetical protein Tco_1553606 [Tanacetum coccineum]